jgi:saccharopine dehydrogenase-like NADP-dependent oxidoreductase
MKDIVVVGAGQIGAVIARLLAGSGDYAVTLVDRSSAALAACPRRPRLQTQAIDVGDAAALRGLLAGKFAVLSAAPFQLTVRIAQAARDAGAHYLDLTEDVASTRAVRALAEGADSAFIPQCGLAPGMISIIAADLARRFETVHDMRLRVGALPETPVNALGYNLTWSTDGLINEYCEAGEAIAEGALCRTRPLDEVETLRLGGVAYEAFNTSGGLGSLCETFAGRVRNLNYKTVRYPGHAMIMRLLLEDLRLRDRRDVLKDILESALPTTARDVVIVFVSVSGIRQGRLGEDAYHHHIHAGEALGEYLTAIQSSTAAGICAVLDRLSQGGLPARGLTRQEDIPLNDMLANRFGRVYAPGAGWGDAFKHAAQ